ncbi:MAG: alanine:cation symporter family protein [Actinomyces ruminicola]|uniref:Alanine or glycine:cation symporter, AGCS family n=1 Tax=Actinomyces ruminicola TaxID=332524 RepID=A0A1G9U081_9ACTO|nr:alanine/glycine:cation symporter family protein [Actinomyces ruminicola]MBE6482182.1 alanine:cation symporter family protein [Actinomyces ruminicola]SDM53288.1 alanine or glycine:cation symporter, AGCS family [Actinomyces ruminicola]
MNPLLLPAAGLFDGPATVLADISDHLYGQLLAWLLIAAGLWFTWRTRFLQLRLFPQMLRAITASRGDVGEGMSSFQAFTVGLASRVGTGNIVGVAIAITMGGPGAVFWMWIVALVGMATGFVESTLAQLFKVAHPDGTFRGGPAYYIHKGLGSKKLASVFAVVITFVFGFAYEATQANAISNVLKGTFNVEPWVTAIVLVLITTPVVFKGIKRVAAITEWLAPLMALVYVIIAVVVLVLNIGAIPAALVSVFKGAFGADQAFWGLSGGFMAAALNGIKRGLFSNEAGEGSVPNAAATATVHHPVQQGFIQSMGVFVDTIVVCTATALIILLSGVYDPATADLDAAGTLTVTSVANVLGPWAQYLMAIVVFVFAYSSLLGNYAYAEVNMDFLRGMGRRHYGVRAMIVVAAALGAVASLSFVWNLSDVAMGVMAIINIVSVVLLGKWSFGALRDWEQQQYEIDEGLRDTIYFVATGNPYLPRELPGDIWTEEAAAERRSETTAVRAD